MSQKTADAKNQHMMMPCQLSASFCCNMAKTEAAMLVTDLRGRGRGRGIRGRSSLAYYEQAQASCQHCKGSQPVCRERSEQSIHRAQMLPPVQDLLVIILCWQNLGNKVVAMFIRLHDCSDRLKSQRRMYRHGQAASPRGLCQVTLLIASFVVFSPAAHGNQRADCTELGYIRPLLTPVLSCKRQCRNDVVPLAASPHQHPSHRFTGLQLCSDCDTLATYVSDAGMLPPQNTW